ncbi:FMN-dependent alpha-hydroxy acid dehydrogenase family protein [Alloalcanivorax dieselolei B5]|uniref:FMN-dependent alpha-hydroxy acid dehydrogenase family protein n=1 Tax=Alcanivorax dieselolei (strain DSM 16502 / CGMCC 1.3690 / MCCC 1A00001 / B-5) TaxID=930169 RepID=K0CHQ3_ALCDB|nr:alpha-hydroxy acid oxidase [Alloalcanivorax dieselolei]AFT71126.1 FMN-dependent alpha-hydroxy acid dehydrogenase family protein [Alloalcanivorax dieselolei B5]GGJ93274.1 lactate dehydrogenase [Alloalcanivorax dieselolei]
MGKPAWGPGSKTGNSAHMTYAAPTYEFLEARARRRVPKFAFDFVQGGTGADRGIETNRRALDAVEIIPRYGNLKKADTTTTLFGTRFMAPIGIAPVGMDALIWPGATTSLARAAKASNIPYITGTLANSPLEEVADIAGGERTWLQLYGFPRDDHRVTIDMVRRAKAAGIAAIVATLDAPVRAKRPRDLHNRLVVPFRPTLKTVWEVATSPAWARALVRHGTPKFANINRYVDGAATLDRVAGFVQKELIGSFSWAEIALMRKIWDGALIVKGVLHPEDAEAAVNVGADAILISNHGGRQSDAAPSPINVLPAIRDRVNGRARLLFDSGIRSGLDVMRALALGAEAAFSGRGFLYALAALGEKGGTHFADLLREEFAVAMAQSGASTVADIPDVSCRHAHAYRFPNPA